MTKSAVTKPKFTLGRVLINKTAVPLLPRYDLDCALKRHRIGDWGEVGKPEWARNEKALRANTSVCSLYHASNGISFYVITEWNRLVTLVQLADDEQSVAPSLEKEGALVY